MARTSPDNFTGPKRSVKVEVKAGIISINRHDVESLWRHAGAMLIFLTQSSPTITDFGNIQGVGVLGIRSGFREKKSGLSDAVPPRITIPQDI